MTRPPTRMPSALLIGLMSLAILAGCAADRRHRSLLSDRDLHRAQAQTIDLDAFLELPNNVQRQRAQAADRAAQAWVGATGLHERQVGLYESPLLYRKAPFTPLMPAVVGDLIEHLDTAVGLDPTRADLWYAHGLLLDLAGARQLACVSLEKAWDTCMRVPERQEQPSKLKRDIAILAAWIERDAGWWDAGLAWLDRARSVITAGDAEAVLLRGLLLAGRGDLEAAMHLSYGLPAVTVPVVWRRGFAGLKREPTDILKRWLQAEVWLRRGDMDLAWYSLGKLPLWRNVPLSHRFWQDMGLYAEISGDGRASTLYALAYWRQPHRMTSLAPPLGCDPVISDLPRPHLVFFRTASGALAAGSPFSHAASTTMLAVMHPDLENADQRYLLAQEALEVCLRRGIHPVEALALRGQLRFSRGYYVLAEMDLALARQQFAARSEVEPWTSYLLGLISVGRNRHDEAEALLTEAVTADPALAGAWNALGVASLQRGRLDQARTALDQAVKVGPQFVQSWYNRGLLRCQDGDLAGGLADFTRAARLDPENLQVGRIIQLATAAQKDGVPLLPWRDVSGKPQPLAVEVLSHEGGAFGPRAPESGEVWLQHLLELFSDRLAETGLAARTEGLDADELADLVDLHTSAPSAAHRKQLAFGYAWLGYTEDAQRLLAASWGVDLDEDEVLLLLWLDQRQGESTRHRELLTGELGDLPLVPGDQGVLADLLSMIGEWPGDEEVANHQPDLERMADIRASRVRFGGPHYLYLRMWHRATSGMSPGDRGALSSGGQGALTSGVGRGGPGSPP